MKKNIITVVLGTLLLFIWNAISWLVLPFHTNTLNNIPDPTFDKEILQKHLPKDGVYHYPGLPRDQSAEALNEIKEKLREGPRITLMVVKKGPSELFDPKSFLKNLLLNVLTVITAFYLISRIGDKSFKTVFLSTSLLGLMVAFVSDLPQMNWYMFPIDYTLTNVFDHIVSFSLLGTLFALFTFRNN